MATFDVLLDHPRRMMRAHQQTILIMLLYWEVRGMLFTRSFFISKGKFSDKSQFIWIMVVSQKLTVRTGCL